ncbi:hypothetical protein PQR14_28245, partial [Paraburkholderia bryophila]
MTARVGEFSGFFVARFLIACLFFEQVQRMRTTVKNDSVTERPVGIVVRLLAAFMLLTVAFGANAFDCLTPYAQSGATPGSKTCRLDVVSNTPGGMGNYACINDLALIDQWCAAPKANEPEASCPIADPVYPGNGAVTLTEADFVSGDDLP